MTPGGERIPALLLKVTAVMRLTAFYQASHNPANPLGVTNYAYEERRLSPGSGAGPPTSCSSMQDSARSQHSRRAAGLVI